MHQHKGQDGQKSSTFAYLDVIHGLTNEIICVTWHEESVSDSWDTEETRQQGPGQAEVGGLVSERPARGHSRALLLLRK